MPSPGFETALANLSVAVWKLLAFLVLGLSVLVVLALLAGGGLDEQSFYLLVAWLLGLAALALGMGGFFVLAAILRAIERIELRMARAIEAGALASGRIAVDGEASTSVSVASPAGAGETYRGVSIRARADGIYDLVQIGKEATSLAEARLMIDRHLA